MTLVFWYSTSCIMNLENSHFCLDCNYGRPEELKVAITHARHVCSQLLAHSCGLALRMIGMRRTQSNHQRLMFDHVKLTQTSVVFAI